MSTASNKLRQMVTEAPDQVVAIGSSIGQIEDHIAEVTEEISAIIVGACTPGETNSIDIIENTILPAIIDGDHVSYGSTFGVANIDWSPAGNLTDWEILDEFDAVLYTYNPTDYPNLDDFVDDFAFNNDYLTRPLISGASYGLIPTQTNLEFAKSILQENLDKVSDSISILNKYSTGGIYT